MLGERLHAERGGRRALLERQLQVPYLDLAVVGAAHDALAVEAYAAHELVVALEHAQALAELDVPQADGVVRAAADDQIAAILEARDAALVAGECAHVLARGRLPHLDGAVAGGGDDVARVEVDDVDGGAVPDERALDLNVGGRVHVPDDDLPVLGARDHDAVHEAQVEHGLLVVVQRLHVGARRQVPHAHRGVRRAADNDRLVVLQAEHAARVAREGAQALAPLLVPYLDGVVAQAAHDLLVVVLETVDALAALRAAVDLARHALALRPVGVELLAVARYVHIQLLVERVLLVDVRVPVEVHVVLEQVLDPAAVLAQAAPHRVRVDLALDELLPQHALADDAQPLFAHQLGRAQRARVHEGEDVLGEREEAARRQLRDEVALQHRLEERVDVAVLVVAHAPQQCLHELRLLARRPPLEQLQTCLLFAAVDVDVDVAVVVLVELIEAVSGRDRSGE